MDEFGQYISEIELIPSKSLRQKGVVYHRSHDLSRITIMVHGDWCCYS